MYVIYDTEIYKYSTIQWVFIKSKFNSMLLLKNMMHCMNVNRKIKKIGKGRKCIFYWYQNSINHWIKNASAYLFHVEIWQHKKKKKKNRRLHPWHEFLNKTRTQFLSKWKYNAKWKDLWTNKAMLLNLQRL